MQTQISLKPGAPRTALKIVGTAFGVGVLSLIIIVLLRSLLDIDSLPGIKVIQVPPDYGLLVIMLGVDMLLRTMGYFLLRNGLPGRHWAVKGGIFAALVYFSALLPNTLSLIAFDFGGSFDWINLILVESYKTIASDGLAGLISGMALALALGVGVTPAIRLTRRTVLAMAVGAVAFPLALLGITEVGRWVSISYVPDVPAHAIAWFYWTFYGVFALTGALLPLFYTLTERGLSGTWWQKGLKFTGIYYACAWLVTANFMIVWGWDLVAGLIFSIVSLLSILLVVLGTAWYLSRRADGGVR